VLTAWLGGIMPNQWHDIQVRNGVDKKRKPCECIRDEGWQPQPVAEGEY